MNSEAFTVFVLEDDQWYNKLLVHNLSLDPDIITESFFSASDFLQRIRERPHLVTLDYRLPDASGSDILKKIKNFDPRIEVVVISEQEEIETAVELLKNGAFDYLVKNENIRERLLNTVRKIKERTSLQDRISNLQKEIEHKYSFRNLLLGKSKPMIQLFELMEKAVNTSITVSIYGETGTGKELVAKAIHYNSAQREKPFVAVNMAAIPSELAESELFGHEKGAFTGAINRRKGKFEEAGEGTIFLDEIAEMDFSLQAKLLRVLQEKEITRIGANQTVKTNCRIIAATHRNLPELVEEGKFREDLYYRLLGLPIHMPPLRNRGDDILLLARHFSDNFCKENNLQPKAFAENAKEKLYAYHWPGNVRELKSVTELATVMAGSDTLQEEHITLPDLKTSTPLSMQEMTLKEYNMRILDWFLEKYNNDIKRVSQKLEISPATIYRMLKKVESSN